MFGNFDFNIIYNSIPYLFKVGMVFTIKLTVMAMIIGLSVGILLAMMRLSSIKILSVTAAAYVNLIRSIPLILVIFWFYFLMPYIAAWFTGSKTPVHVGAFISSVITFSMFEAAYYCEIIRSGIQSIPRGQVYAGQTIGMNYWQNMRYIILPQAILGMIPVLLTQTIILFQDASLVYILSITDFFGAADKIARRDGRVVEMYTFVAVVYFIICFSLSSLIRRLNRRIESIS